jgi:hypothetical protein
MKFKLYLNLQSLIILPENINGDPKYQLLSQRDPDIPLEFKIGFAYFNPLLKNKERLQAYLMTAEGLMGYQSGKPLAKLLKAEQAKLGRGWFELPRQPPELVDFSPQLLSLLVKTPALVGVIAQNIRTHFGLRVPDDINCVTKAEWMSWLAKQELPLRPSLRSLFTSLFINQYQLVFTEENREFMLTGIQPEPTYTVQLRWMEIQETKIVIQQLAESLQWEILVPESVFKEGTAAIIDFANKQLGPEWSKVEKQITGESKIETGNPEKVSSGPVIFYHPKHVSEFALYSPDSWDRNTNPSIIDSIMKVINES